MFDTTIRKKIKVNTAPAGNRNPTLLYNLGLRGEDTGDVESLYSLLQRLAFAHAVPPSKLVNVMLPSQAEVKAALSPSEQNQEIMRSVHGKGWGWAWGWDKDAGKLMIGTGGSARNWAKALGIATGNRYLAEGTLADLTDHISSTGLITDEERICLACVRDDAKSGGRPYERLLWRLGPITCCPVHKKRLVTARCGAKPSKAQDPYLRIKHPGVCCGCGSVAFTCISEPPSIATPVEVWHAQQCKELLNDIATDWPVRPEVLPLIMKRVIKDHAQNTGGLQHFAERVGASKSNLSEWLGNERQRTSLAQLIDIAWVEGVSLAGLVQGRLIKVNTPDGCRAPHRIPKVSKRVDHQALREAMKQAIQEGRSASEVAHDMQVDLSTLAIHSELYTAMRGHTALQQLADDTFRRSAAIAEARQMAEHLLNEGKPVTLRNASASGGDSWMPSQLRSQSLSVIARELSCGESTACAKVGAQTRNMAIEAARELLSKRLDQPRG